MKKRQFFIAAALLFCLSSAKSFAEEKIPYGIVNFPSCLQESKYGKEEQASFDKVRERMVALITDIEKQLNEIATKFSDPEFVDSLSPEAEQEIKANFQSLSEEHSRYQNQYMQVMQQEHMRVMQAMKGYVSTASDAVRKRKNISLVVPEEACFSYEPSYDITKAVIEEMDKNYDKAHNNVPSKDKAA